MTFFPTTLVVGVDGSPPSRRALQVGLELAGSTGSPLHLLHVRLTTGTLHGRPMTPRQRESEQASGEALLEEEAAVVATRGGKLAATHLRFGDRLGATLAAAAEELDAGLLIIGHSTSARLGELLTSSYPATTVRRAKGSVLVVR